MSNPVPRLGIRPTAGRRAFQRCALRSRAQAPCRPWSWSANCRPAGIPRKFWSGPPRRCPARCRAPKSYRRRSSAAALIGDFASIGELDGIADEIEQHLGEPAIVAAGGRQTRRHFDLERELLAARQRLDRAMDALHQVRNGIIIKREHELPGLDLRQIEHVVDQAEQVLAVGLHALQHAAHFCRRLAVDAVEDQLGVAEDGVERRAQLVAHVGEELRLVLARFFDLAALVVDFVEQPRVLDRQHRLRREGLASDRRCFAGRRPAFGGGPPACRRSPRRE